MISLPLLSRQHNWRTVVVKDILHNTSGRQFELCVANIPDTIEEMQNFKFEDHIVLRGSARISKVLRIVYMLLSSFLVSNNPFV